MNPLTNMKNVTKLSEQALNSSSQSSWHDQYKDSAWVFVGGLPYDLTEGDIICIFSQYGEIVNINLIRDKGTGKSKGFCFLCFEDQRSTILSVDNLNGIKIMNRSIRVDHVSNYKIPKEGKDTDQETKQLYEEGCAPKLEPILPLKVKLEPQDLRETLADHINGDIKLPPRLPIYPIKQEPSEDSAQNIKKIKKSKKKKDKKRKSKKKRDKHSDSDSTTTSEERRSRKSKNTQKRDHSSSSNDHERKGHKLMKTNTDKKYKERRSRSRSRSKDKYERIANNSESYRKYKR